PCNVSPACRRIRGQWNQRPARPWPTTTVAIMSELLRDDTGSASKESYGGSGSAGSREHPVRFDQNAADPIILRPLAPIDSSTRFDHIILIRCLGRGCFGERAAGAIRLDAGSRREAAMILLGRD